MTRRSPSGTVTVHVVCVTKGASTYTARFGYTNPGSATIPVAVGPLNRFSRGEEDDRGQPISFLSGTNVTPPRPRRSAASGMALTLT